MMKDDTPSQRLERKGWTVSDSGCWVFSGRRNSSGYGMLDYKGRAYVASRLAYSSWVGELTDDKLVCHSCDNPPCINPEHLFLGDYSANMDDMKRKGRGNRPHGMRSGNRKITDLDAVAIFQARRKGGSLRELAEGYGISETTVSSIARGKTWRRVTEAIR